MQGQPHLVQRFPVLEAQYSYVQALTEGLNGDTYKLFCHVLASTFIQGKERPNGSIPVWSILIKEKLREANPRLLEERGLIEIKGHNRLNGESREYKITNGIIQHFSNLGVFSIFSIEATMEKNRHGRLDIFTGNTWKGAIKSKITNKSRNREPELLVKAIQMIDICYFNMDKTYAYLQQIHEELTMIPESTPLHRRREAALRNDLFVFESIMSQEPVKTDIPGIYSFVPQYTTQQSGRLSSPYVNARQAMKAAMYFNVPKFKNYDLVGAQAHALAEELQKANIRCFWLDNYLSDPKAKEKYAQAAGLSVSAWKRCLYAIIMGGYLPRDIRRSRSTSAIRETLEGEFGPNLHVVNVAYGRLQPLLLPLKDALDVWHEYLLKELPQAPKALTRALDKQYLTNACGKKICYTDLLTRPEYKAKAELAAFMLQGKEAAFIHHLTGLGSVYGFQSIGNEYDGLLTRGKIPEAAVEEARQLSGFKTAYLDIKDFIPFVPIEEAALIKKLA